MVKKNAVILFHPAIENQYYRCIPYALLYLERMVRDLDIELILIDENVETDYVPKVMAVADRILFVGISAIIGSQITGGVRFAKFIKNLSNDNRVLWGGWHSTILPEQTLQEDYIDYVITGQAEESFRSFVKALLNNESITGICNLNYKQQGVVKSNPSATFCDFNKYPPVNYDLVDVNNYMYYPSFAQKSIVYFASHGCPYNCSFCAMATFYKQKWIPRSIEIIINDLRYFKDKAGIDSVFFQDDNFFTNKEFSLALCRAMIDNKLNLKWETWTHAGGFLRMFTDDDLMLIYKAGCRQIISGSESGSQQVLDMVNKKLTVDDNLLFVRLLKRHGITPFFSVMLSFPGNAKDELDQTLELIRQAKLIDNTLKVYFSFYTPYPGTKLYQAATFSGFQTPSSLEGWANHTFDDFHGPWWDKELERKLELFAHFYIPLSNPFNYRNFPRPPFVKTVLFIINKLFNPLVMLRFKYNLFAFPVEAVLFLKLLRLFNKLFGTHYKLYPF